MKPLRLFFLSLIFSCPIMSIAQTTSPTALVSMTLPVEARQFDFLLGQWTIEVHPKVSGLVAMIHGAPHMLGTWKASRSANGLGVEDEMRVVDGSGNPLSLNHTQRVFIAADKSWKVTSNDITHQRVSEASGHWIDAEMRLQGHFVEDARQTLTRTRYFDITADSFRMQQDRSSDNGQSWDEAVLTIEAKRAVGTSP